MGIVSIASVVFLLLFFFVVTTSFITPFGIPLKFPKSEQRVSEYLTLATVTITKDLKYFVDRKEVTRGTLEGELKSRLKGQDGWVVVLIDQSVPAEHLITVADVITKLDAKVIIGTKPE